MTKFRSCAVAAALVFTAGCGDDVGDNDSDAVVAPSDAPTYFGAIKTLVDDNCVSCHFEGGETPFSLQTLADVSGLAEVALGSIEAGRMPPWRAADDCQPYLDRRGLTADEIATFRAWVEGGKLEGADTGEPVFVPELAAFEPTHSAPVANGYLADPSSPDDYHCFILDFDFDEDTYLIGSRISPGNSTVHHVLAYAIGPRDIDRLAEADAAEPGPGYTCYGGPLDFAIDGDGFVGFLSGGDMPSFEFPGQLAGWAPGGRPTIYPEGVATRIEAGSKIVVQIHYNLVGTEPVVDNETSFDMILTSDEPEFLGVTRPVAVQSLNIEAGDPSSTQTAILPYYGSTELEIHAVSGHMHMLGTQIVGQRLNAEREVDACVLDIPDWDFNWQDTYYLPTDDPVIVRSGEALQVSCTYDNSAGNQAVVNGEQLAPRDVRWGDGSLDEMCIMYVGLRVPFTPSPGAGAALCAGTEDCMAECGDSPSLDCIYSCDAASIDCQLCATRAGLRCSDFDCVGSLSSAGACLSRCISSNIMLTGNLGMCLASECATAYEAVTSCVDAALGADGCAAEFAACGVSLAE